MKKTLRQKLQELGGDIWVIELGGERRIKENESWKGYKRDLLIWFNTEEFNDNKIVEAVELIKKLPPITRIKVSGCRVTSNGIETLKYNLPEVLVDFVQNR